MSVAVLIFAILASLAWALMLTLFGLDFLEASVGAALAFCAAAGVHYVQIHQHPAMACALGADGIAVGDGYAARRLGPFIPWSRISRIDRRGDRVIFTLHGGDTYVVQAWRGSLYVDARARFDRFKQERGAEEREGYRENEQDPAVLVRVARDPGVEPDRRARAYRKLTPDTRREVVESIADPEIRKRFVREADE